MFPNDTTIWRSCLRCFTWKQSVTHVSASVVDPDSDPERSGIFKHHGSGSFKHEKKDFSDKFDTMDESEVRFVTDLQS